MSADASRLKVRFARNQDDLTHAQRLRYRVFVEELGATGPMVNHEARLECDEFDEFASHLLLLDPAREDHPEGPVIGVYRMLDRESAARAGRFYSESEFDLTPLLTGGRKLLELGRSCMHPDYRGGSGMFLLWNALAGHVLSQGVEVLFGTASFHGTDIAVIAPPLAYLQENHLAPEDLRVSILPEFAAEADVSHIKAPARGDIMPQVPALIRAYLRLGGFVGQGAYVDHGFNTTDICLILDIERMNARQRALYSRGHV